MGPRVQVPDTAAPRQFPGSNTVSPEQLAQQLPKFACDPSAYSVWPTVRERDVHPTEVPHLLDAPPEMIWEYRIQKAQTAKADVDIAMNYCHSQIPAEAWMYRTGDIKASMWELGTVFRQHYEQSGQPKPAFQKSHTALKSKGPVFDELQQNPRGSLVLLRYNINFLLGKGELCSYLNAGFRVDRMYAEVRIRLSWTPQWRYLQHLTALQSPEAFEAFISMFSNNKRYQLAKIFTLVGGRVSLDTEFSDYVDFKLCTPFQSEEVMYHDDDDDDDGDVVIGDAWAVGHK